METLLILGVCIFLGVVGIISTKYMGADNPIEKDAEELIEAELGTVSKPLPSKLDEKPKPK